MLYRRTRFLVLATLLVLTTGLLSGCWDKKEAEDLAYVRATVIDRAPAGKVRLFVQVPNPRAIGGGAAAAAITPGASIPSKPYRNYEAEGTTVFEAVRRMASQVPRQLFWGQDTLVIFPEGLAREGLAPYLDFLERSVEIRRRLVNVLVTPSDPRVLLDIPGIQELAPSTRIERILDNDRLSSRFAVVNLSDFFEMLATEGQEAYCGVVRARENPTRPPAAYRQGAPEPDPVIEVSGAAAFRGDRFAGYLTERETQGLLWTRGMVRGGTITVRAPEGKGEVTVEIISHGKSRIVPDIRDGRLLARVEVKGVKVNVADSEAPLDFNRPDVVRALERALAREIEGEVLAAAAKAEHLGSDVLGVGAAFRRNFPDE